MKVKDLENKFPNFTVLAVNGKNVALLSDKGVPYISTAEKNGEEIAVGLTTEIAVNACFYHLNNFGRKILRFHFLKSTSHHMVSQKRCSVSSG